MDTQRRFTRERETTAIIGFVSDNLYPENGEEKIKNRINAIKSKRLIHMFGYFMDYFVLRTSIVLKWQPLKCLTQHFSLDLLLLFIFPASPRKE